jgi:uroporphyrinogen-III synthase
MKLLFLKSSVKHQVLKNLPEAFSCDFMDVISIKFLEFSAPDFKPDYYIFTSPNAVRAIVKMGITLYPAAKILVVGNKTRCELSLHDWPTEHCFADVYELASYIASALASKSFWHFKGNLSLESLEDHLTKQHIIYHSQVVYKTQLIYPEITQNYDGIVFFSPSAAKSYFRFNQHQNQKLYALGSSTATAILQFTSHNIYKAAQPNTQAVLNLIIDNQHD